MTGVLCSSAGSGSENGALHPRRFFTTHQKKRQHESANINHYGNILFEGQAIKLFCSANDCKSTQGRAMWSEPKMKVILVIMCFTVQCAVDLCSWVTDQCYVPVKYCRRKLYWHFTFLHKCSECPTSPQAVCMVFVIIYLIRTVGFHLSVKEDRSERR